MAAVEWKTKKKRVTVRFSVTDRGEKNVISAISAENCGCHEGVLRSVGVSQLTRSDGSGEVCPISGVIAFRWLKTYDGASKTYRKRLCALTSDGKLYAQTAGTDVYTLLCEGMTNAELVRFVGKDLRARLGAFGEQRCVLVDDDGSVTALALEKPSGAACFFKHRLFVGVKPATLAYSAAEDPTEFSESADDGGYIRFPYVGEEIVAIKTFGDRLYLFFDHGILRLDTAGSPREFVAEKLEYTGGKIFGRTVCVLSVAIVFLASDGAYRFDGKSAERLFENFVKLPFEETKSESCAVWKNRALIRYAVADGTYKTLAVYEDGKDCFYMDDLTALSAEDGGMVLFKGKNDGVFELCEKGENAVGTARFESAETDLGVSERKTLTRLYFQGEGSFLLSVRNAGRVSERKVAFENGAAEVRLSERGERFAFGFALETGTAIKEMTADMKVLA